MTRLLVLVVAILALALAACVAAETAPIGDGQVVYETRVAGGNTYTCATCHALAEPASDGLRRPGHPIGDATRRPHFKNGTKARFIDAVNGCLTEWMNADPWTEDDSRYRALHAFLDARATAPSAPALRFDRVDAP